jgi:hypothetical protein
MTHKIGQKGGHARAAALTPEQRTKIAKMGAESRWGKKPAPNHSMSWHNTPPGIESQAAYYVGGEYILQGCLEWVKLIHVVDGEWALCRVGDGNPFVTELENLKK